jgi:GAF domain-containing protein
VFACERGHALDPGQLRIATASRVSTALWMAIEALESEAAALRTLSSLSRADGDAAALADRAEEDARLLRKVTSRTSRQIMGARMRSTELIAAVEAVAQFLVADVPLGQTLERVAVLAVDALAPAAAVGLTLVDDRGRPSTRVFTDAISPAVDQGQYEDDQGPCLDALREGRIVRVEDTAAEAARWPSYTRRAIDNGVTSTLSLPMTAGADRLGVMNMYATGGAFVEHDEADAQLFATQAAVVLANARAYWTAHDLGAGLSKALESRAMIDMAKGKLMSMGACTPDEAFQLLVKASQRENVPLRTIARRLVEGEVAESAPTL